MYIGEISKRTGLSIKAIRLYEEKGLIPKPSRQGRYRVYQQTDIELLLLIKEAKGLGVTLAQLRDVIVIHNGVVDWPHISQFLASLKQIMQTQISDLSKRIEKIDTCIKEIDACN